MLNKTEVRAYMREVVEEFVDPKTDLVNATQLAEDALIEFNVRDPIDEETMFELSADVAISFEDRRARYNQEFPYSLHGPAI